MTSSATPLPPPHPLVMNWRSARNAPTLPPFPLLPMPEFRATSISYMEMYYLADSNRIRDDFIQLRESLHLVNEDAFCVVSPNAPYYHFVNGERPKSTCTVSIHVSDRVDAEAQAQLKAGLQAIMQEWKIRDPTHPAFNQHRQ